MEEALVEALDMTQMGKRARAAAGILAQKSTAEKNAVLMAIAEALEAKQAGYLASERTGYGASQGERNRSNLDSRSDCLGRADGWHHR